MSLPKAFSKIAATLAFSLALLGLTGCPPEKDQAPTPVAPTPSPAPPVQAPFLSAETPIKVGGGAMTFYSQRIWDKSKSVPGGFCTEIDLTNLSIITGERFFDPTGTVKQPDISISAAGPTWTMQLLGHAEAEPNGLTPGANGITMQAAATGCAGDSKVGSVTISPISGSQGDLTTYSPLLTTKVHIANRRYADTSCKKDRDRCERLAKLTLRGTKMNDGTYGCPDGECRIHIGS